jgi:hypothetical protein
MQAKVATDMSGLLRFEKAWESLLPESGNPSIFMTFDYQYAGWSAFHSRDSQPLLVAVHDAEGRLAGIAPFKTFRDRGSLGRWRTLEYLNTFEIDRPCPVIRKGMEAEFWQMLRKFVIESGRVCDVMKLRELPAEHASYVRQAFESPRVHVEESPGPGGIGIDLRTTWADFIGRHKNLRKQMGRIERQQANLEIEHYEGPERILQGLGHYIDIERSSWKAGKKGITKDARHQTFYTDLLVRLARRNRVTVRLLKVGGKFVAGEITYTLGRRVFFHQGVYDQAHADWSPGTYLSGKLLADYMDNAYDSGDYLCGFADYLRPWCDLEWKTVNTTIVRNSLPMRLSRVVESARSYGKGVLGRVGSAKRSSRALAER